MSGPKTSYESKKNPPYKPLRKMLKETPINIPLNEFTEPTQAMPDDVKVVGDSITAYRQYYIKHKKGFATWKKDRQPEWYTVNG